MFDKKINTLLMPHHLHDACSAQMWPIAIDLTCCVVCVLSTGVRCAKRPCIRRRSRSPTGRSTYEGDM